MTPTTCERGRKALKAVFDSVPKGKFVAIVQDASDLELAFGDLCRELDFLRGYFLETAGEGSPFVARIDRLVPRTGGAA